MPMQAAFFLSLAFVICECVCDTTRQRLETKWVEHEIWRSARERGQKLRIKKEWIVARMGGSGRERGRETEPDTLYKQFNLFYRPWDGKVLFAFFLLRFILFAIAVKEREREKERRRENWCHVLMETSLRVCVCFSLFLLILQTAIS